MKQLKKKIRVSTTIELITGLHIGGGSDKVEIGGIDNPVIKIGTKDNQPYIPGSSLKGKMRCLLEQIKGSSKVGGNDEVNNLFGFSGDNKPSKIIVRDSYMQEQSVDNLKNCDGLDMPYTETKCENVINRVKGTAENPRIMERIPAGVVFDSEVIINVWDSDDDGKELIALFEEGIKALENDYIGGNGTRGYGQIRFGERKYQDIIFDNK